MDTAANFGPGLAAAEAPSVYSYTRFSTPEQAAGDSKRRQIDAAVRWTERKSAERLAAGEPPLALDDRLRLNDLGVSAFRGSNTGEDRGLGGFLTACRSGLIESGSYLLVESLDRISRMTPRRVSRLLDDIVDAGVTIVTLSDGQEYDAFRLDSDPTALLIALMVSWRAHEESKVKGQRVAAAWAEKRKRLREGTDKKLTRRGPAWLAWDESKEEWTEKAPHADTVRRIFDMALAGVGEHSTAAALNRERVPVMGRGAHWHRSTVAKILRNPAVIGTLTPGRMDFSTGRRSRILDTPIEGAYPPVVSDRVWAAVRTIKDGSAPAVRGRGAGRPLSNLLAGLARCPDCGASMTRVNKGSGPKGGKPKLVCTRSKVGAATHPYTSVSLCDVEAAFRADWQLLTLDVPAGVHGPDLDREADALRSELIAAEEGLTAAAEAFEAAPSVTLAARIQRAEASLATARDRVAKQAHRRASADHGLIDHRLAALTDAMAGEGAGDPAKVNAALRVLFRAVVVDHRAGVLAFQWRQGGQTNLTYTWPECGGAN